MGSLGDIADLVGPLGDLLDILVGLLQGDIGVLSTEGSLGGIFEGSSETDLVGSLDGSSGE